MRLRTTLGLAALFLCAPSYAQRPAEPPQGTLYLGHGRMLEIEQPRQLTLNAGVIQFLYQPGGLEIAYSGDELNGNVVTQAVRLIGVKKGTPIGTLLSETNRLGADGKPSDDNAGVLMTLSGWSGDGRFLLIKRIRSVPLARPEFPGDFHEQNDYVLADVGADPIRMTTLAQQDGGQGSPTDTVSWWSPNRSKILFAAQGVFRDGAKPYIADTFCSVYDPAQSRMTPVPLTDGQFTIGWLDDSHLLLKRTKGGTTQFARYDITAGSQEDIPAPAKIPRPIRDNGMPPPLPAASPKAAFLQLEEQRVTVTDPQQVAQAETRALWVRRTAGPKPQSAASVGLAPGQEDSQARWSPNGAQIAFVSHGDLVVTDLVERDATPTELLGAGEPLNCDQERQVAVSHLKQIGLGILMYVQDNNERFPAPSRFQNNILPYVKDAGLFSMAGHPFIYYAPPNLSLASIESPATTIVGTMDLPCARIILYVDGHVKEMLKPGM